MVATRLLSKDGKTIIWNNHPKGGDIAIWSGKRGRDEYARGFGALAWYKKESLFRKAQLYRRYWGNMSEGKFSGPVNVYSLQRLALPPRSLRRK